MNSINTGLFGEYYVAAMMHLRGWTGVLTLKNYPNVDILGYDTSTQKTSKVLVKTGANKYNVLTGQKSNTFNANKIVGPYVFVHVLPNNDIECFILKQQDVILLSQNFINGKNGTSDVPIKFSWNSLKPFKNQWNNLW